MLWRVARIRRAALDLLIVLRDLEERAWVPLSDDAYDAGSDRSVARRRQNCPMCPPTRHFPSQYARGQLVRVDPRFGRGGRFFNVDEESERLPRERWDERLVLRRGWLYKQDLKIEDLKKQ